MGWRRSWTLFAFVIQSVLCNIQAAFVGFNVPRVRIASSLFHKFSPRECKSIYLRGNFESAKMCASSSDGKNSSVFLSSVEAVGNLRSRAGVNPVEKKRNIAKAKIESNFKVKSLQNKNFTTTSFHEAQKGSNFHNLVDFPCNFQIKVVGICQGEFVEDILDSIANVVQQSPSSLKHSFRDNGKWRSITVHIPVMSAEQLYEVYEVVGRDPRVKFKF